MAGQASWFNRQHFATFLSYIDKRMQRNLWRSSTWWRADRPQAVEHSLKQVLQVAYQEQLDAAQLVHLLGVEQRGRSRRQMLRLASDLQSGRCLADALEQNPSVLNDEDALDIRLGIQSGMLGSTLKRLACSESEYSRYLGERTRMIVTYFGIMAFVVVVFATFLANFIAPIFFQVSSELGINGLPGLDWMGWIRDKTFFLILLVPLVFVVKLLLGRLGLGRYLLRGWPIHVLSPLANRRTARLLERFAEMLRHGRGLPGGMSTLARYHFDPGVRNKLLFARNEIEQGRATWDSLQQIDLLSKDQAKALADLDDRPTQGWLLQQLAMEKQVQVERTAAFMLVLLHPLLVILLASVVLFLVYFGFAFLKFTVVELA